MKKIIVLGLATFGYISISFSQNNNGVLSLKKGQKYVVETKVTTTSSSEMQGQSMETNADVSTIYNIQVDDVKDNNYSMTNSISAVKLNMTTMGQTVNFDSDKKEDMDGEMGGNFKSYINHPNPVVMDKSGNIIIPDKSDTVKNDSSVNAASVMLKQLGDPEQQGYGAAMAFAPIQKNIKPGTAWRDSTSKDGIVKVTNYTVKDVKGKIATVAISGTETRDVKMQMQGMEINTKTNGKFSGEETVDITTGVVQQNDTTMDATGNIYVMGQEIPTTVKATSVTTVKPM